MENNVIFFIFIFSAGLCYVVWCDTYSLRIRKKMIFLDREDFYLLWALSNVGFLSLLQT